MFRASIVAYNTMGEAIKESRCYDADADQAIFGAMQRLRAEFPVGKEYSWTRVEIRLINERPR